MHIHPNGVLCYSVSDIKVTINNTGPGAYRPEVYGDCITVERKLIRSGGGDYKIRTATGSYTLMFDF